MVDSVCGPCIVTWRCLDMFSVEVAEEGTFRSVSSAINQAVAGKTR